MMERPEEERARLLEQAVQRGMRVAMLDPEHRKDLVKEAMREVLREQDPAERTKAVKEAYKEIMRDIALAFGRWSLAAIGAAVVITLVGAMLYLGAIKAGWTPPK